MNPESRMGHDGIKELRRRVYLLLEQGPIGGGVGRWIERLLVALILVNLVAVALESMPEFGERYAVVFDLIEYVSLAVFTLEYILRLWSAVEHGPHRNMHPLRARLKYALSPAGLIDLIAVLPFWFALVLPADLRFVLVFRFAWCASSRSRAIRRPCARCSTCSIANVARCSAA
jgi:voltage-gated potassium channel